MPDPLKNPFRLRTELLAYAVVLVPALVVVLALYLMIAAAIRSAR